MACVERKKSRSRSRAASHTNMVGWLRRKGHGPPYLLPFPLSMINQNAHDRISLVGPTCLTLPSATSSSHYHPRQPNTRQLHHSHQLGLGGFALFTRNLDLLWAALWKFLGSQPKAHSGLAFLTCLYFICKKFDKPYFKIERNWNFFFAKSEQWYST